MVEKLLIVGGSGMLGTNLARILASQFEVYATYNSFPISLPGCTYFPLNVTLPEDVVTAVNRLEPNLIINCAALTNLDYCEAHPYETEEVNAFGAEYVAQAARLTSARLIHVSTDSIFDGLRGMYREDNVPNPLNVYSRAKLAGEQAVLAKNPDSIVLRTAFYGWGLGRGASLAEWAISGIRAGKQLTMFTDTIFSPIYVEDFINAMLELHKKRVRGIYHLGGSQPCSKYEFGLALAAAFNIKTDIKPGSISASALKAIRPFNVSLDVNKAAATLGRPLPDLASGLNRFRAAEGEILSLRSSQCAP